MMPLNTPDMILSRVDTNGPNGCWIWTGALTEHGYGVTAYRRKRTLLHRFTYELFIGPIDPKLNIDHLCRVRSCCNPTHLEAVPPGVNTARGANGLALTGYCLKGLHPIDAPGALTRNSSGRRTCAECRRATKRRSYWRLKEQTSRIPTANRTDTTT